jgi:hypothetical protein
LAAGLVSQGCPTKILFPERTRPLATPIFDTIITDIIVNQDSNNILDSIQGDGRDLFKNSTSAV